MGWILFFALMLVAAESLRMLSSRTPATPKWPAMSWILALIASYAVQLAVVFYAAHHQSPIEAWRYAMPLMVVDDRTDTFNFHMANGDLVTGVMLALAALQSYALLALYRGQPSRRAMWIGCAALLALSLAAPALMSFDLYGYVHDALLGRGAYAASCTPFVGEYHVFDLWFGCTPSFYGPLWPVIAPLVTGGAPTLLTKILALRAFSVALYVAFLVGLRALGLAPRLVAVAALNPGLMLQFVANGHNDLVAIVILVYAATLIRTQMWLGFALIAVAGLFKIPYALLGLPLAAAVRPMWLRLAGIAAALAVVAIGSWFGGGAPYLHALLWYAGRKPDDLYRIAAALVGLALIAVAVFGKRRWRSAVWAMPALSGWFFAWYIAWGLPYALARRRILSYLLVCFPFAAMLVESAFTRRWETAAVLPAVVLLSIFAPEKPLVIPRVRGRAARASSRKAQRQT